MNILPKRSCMKMLFLVFCIALVTLYWSGLREFQNISWAIRRDFWLNASDSDAHIEIINRILKTQLEQNELKMKDHHFHPNRQHIPDYRGLIPAYGGNPVRSILLSKWRSGSSLLGKLINAQPSSIYFFEPLRIQYKNDIVREGISSEPGLQALKRLMNCDFTGIELHHRWFVQFIKESDYFDPCYQAHSNLCLKLPYRTRYCEIFPFQSIKIVRLQTSLAEEFLKNETYNARVLLLVRDPRAIIASRKHVGFCKYSRDCWDPTILCKDLVSDFYSAQKFLERYAATFSVIRYEDFALDFISRSKQVFDFLGLTYGEEVITFINENTLGEKHGGYGISRDPKTAALHWRTDLTWEKIDSLQEVCAEAIKLWGYKLAHNASHAKLFNPIGTLNVGIH